MRFPGHRKSSILRQSGPPSWAIAALALAALAVQLGGCLEAETLGGAPPDEVSVGDPPTWQNGIGQLMQLKCGVCHQVPRPAVSPENVPDGLDLTQQYPPSSGVLGAVSIIPFLQAGLLRGDLEFMRQMPLKQATPLTENEILALEAWDGT